VSLKLSVLDLIGVRSGQSTSDALAASIALARRADALGYHRYWVAEHHNMPAVASTSPPVAVALLAASTERIRVGSGGVMLPNHSPLVVAEQFALLEAYAPGRIDLGLGRAPGADPVVNAVLHAAAGAGSAEQFPAGVQDIAALLGADGAKVPLHGGKDYPLRSTPAATSAPEIWLLGSSDFTAQLAARLGLPYVFAAHFFAGQGTERALELYRGAYQPSERHPTPRTLITANVVVAPRREEAQALARPQLLQMAFLRSGRPMTPLRTVEEAAATEPSEREQTLIEQMGGAWIVDEPEPARERVRELAARFGADEVMVVPAASAHADAPRDRYPARERTLELLAA